MSNRRRLKPTPTSRPNLRRLHILAESVSSHTTLRPDIVAYVQAMTEPEAAEWAGVDVRQVNAIRRLGGGR